MPPLSLSVSSDLLNILLQYALQLKIDEKEIIAACGINLCEYQGDGARIPMHKFHRIWSFLIERSKDRNFGLHHGEYCYKMLSHHLIFAMMMNCKTAGQAIKKNFQYHNLIMDIIQPKTVVIDEMACLTWEMNGPSIPFERHFSESILALQVKMLHSLTEDSLHIEEIRFSHDNPDNTDEHERIFHAPVVFGCRQNEIRFPKSYLEAPVLLANSSVLEGLEQLVQAQFHQSYATNSYTQKVIRILFREILNGNNTDIKTIAGHLAMSARNLQIKLKEENTSFRQLVDSEKKEIAIGCLKDKSASICEIALLLNFSEQSSFQHAFKRWTGRTPGQYRKKSV